MTNDASVAAGSHPPAELFNNYPDAIKKVKSLKLPELRAFDDISEMLKLVSVEEWEDSDEEDLEL